jgi:hypothetical protein
LEAPETQGAQEAQKALGLQEAAEAEAARAEAKADAEGAEGAKAAEAQKAQKAQAEQAEQAEQGAAEAAAEKAMQMISDLTRQGVEKDETIAKNLKECVSLQEQLATLQSLQSAQSGQLSGQADSHTQAAQAAQELQAKLQASEEVVARLTAEKVALQCSVEDITAEKVQLKGQVEEMGKKLIDGDRAWGIERAGLMRDIERRGRDIEERDGLMEGFEGERQGFMAMTMEVQVLQAQLRSLEESSEASATRGVQGASELVVLQGELEAAQVAKPYFCIGFFVLNPILLWICVLIPPLCDVCHLSDVCLCDV